MIVYMIEGWDQCTGVLAEIDLSRELGIKVTFLPS
jgi:hypothetical protein